MSKNNPFGVFCNRGVCKTPLGGTYFSDTSTVEEHMKEFHDPVTDILAKLTGVIEGLQGWDDSHGRVSPTYNAKTGKYVYRADVLALLEAGE